MALQDNPLFKGIMSKLGGGGDFQSYNVDPKMDRLGKRMLGSKWAGLKDRFMSQRKRRGLK